MDYRRAMGVETRFAASGGGRGMLVAILDSGTPPPFIIGDEFQCSDPYVNDEFGHATAVASILFGGYGIRGLCEKARALYIPVLDSRGRGSVDRVSNGIYRAIERGADIINLSLGFGRTEECPEKLKKACEAAFRAEKPIICAAGNDGGLVNWPAALKSTICVGSSAKNGLKTAFSSSGEVDFVAPGLHLPVLDLEGDEKTVSGTSFSAAIATGVSVLIMAESKASGVTMSVDELIRALREISVDTGDPGWDKNTGYGVISGEEADSTVDMMIRPSFFDKIIYKFKSLVGLNKKGDINGSRV